MRTLLCTLVLILSTSLLGAAADPTAIIHTTAGDLHCTLLPKIAPIGVENFIGLANGTKDWTSPISHQKKHGVPLYDGTIFHRVIPQFMIQGGDPAGNGTGDPGYQFKNETSITVTFDRPGRLAYANLNGGYTIFGQCDDAAVDLVKKIARMPTHGEKPVNPVKITHIEIQGAAAPKPSGM
jgi:peptidyl-prolyl cis-trans isomerase A (cyclophilin A)